jgi:hypothetical protein
MAFVMIIDTGFRFAASGAIFCRLLLQAEMFFLVIDFLSPAEQAAESSPQ